MILTCLIFFLRRGLITRNVKSAVDLFHQRFGVNLEFNVFLLNELIQSIICFSYIDRCCIMLVSCCFFLFCNLHLFVQKFVSQKIPFIISVLLYYSEFGCCIHNYFVSDFIWIYYILTIRKATYEINIGCTNKREENKEKGKREENKTSPQY